MKTKLERIAGSSLEAKLKEITKDAYDELVKGFSESLLKEAENNIKKIKREKITNITSWNYSNKFDKIDFSLIDTGSPGSIIYDLDKVKLKSDANAKVKKIAENKTKFILEKFYKKNLSKLKKILDKIGDPDKIELLNSYYSQGSFNSDMIFKWNNGSQFQVRNQIVIVWGQSKDFARYPTTFHNAILSDGKKIKNPSEKKILEEFKI